MAEVGEVEAELMFAAGERAKAQEGERQMRDAGCGMLGKPFLHDKFRLRGGAIGTDAVFDGDAAVDVLAERGVNEAGVRRDVAVDEGEVCFLDGAGFPDLAQFAGSELVFGEEHDAGGFAIEAVDEVGRGWGLASGVWGMGFGPRA